MEKRDFSDEIQANEEEIPKEIDTRKNKQEDLLIEAKNFFEAHKKELLESRRKGSNVVFLDFESLIKFSKMLSDEILEDPEEALRIFEQAIEQSPLIDSVRIRLKNLPKSQTVKIRNIRSKHLNEMIVVEGIIRQASDVQPQVVNAKFECPGCGTVIQVLQIEKKFREPSRCSCGRKGGFKLISKEMVDVQRLIVEEAHESLSGGEQPKKINVFVKEDLVEPKMEEKTTPGSRVRVIGVLKEVAVTLPTGGLSTRFGLAIEANNLIPLEETFEEVGYDEEDERQILELSQLPNIFDKLAESIAPSVWGYEEIKKSLILQLFGGVKKELSDGSNQRGDIHILLVGDPGVAKSVILGFMSKIAPKGRYVVGKSTSGAGLTATVVKDEFLRGWALEAGAMVLANKGLVCIDELEKMDPQDRSAMHEAMEQQTITISKANVQATLRAETSVLAAANPKLGRFNPDESLSSQFDLPVTLINRFDIIFPLRDIPDKEKDRKIARHILDEHNKEGKTMIVPKELFRKYVAYSKQKINPKLSEEAIEEIEKFYIELRSSAVSAESLRPIPISPRQLEALIRMSEASAKLRLDNTITKNDAKIAVGIMNSYMMQVGYDQESKAFDIDKIGGTMTGSKRNKVFMLRTKITEMEERMGKLIPLEELERELEGRLKKDEIDDALIELVKNGIIFEPKKGYIQKMG